MFTLLVPRPYWDPDTDEAAITLELAIPLLAEAAGGTVEGIVGDNDPFVAVQHAVERGEFDELIISTLPARVSRWDRRDLPHPVEAFGRLSPWSPPSSCSLPRLSSVLAPDELRERRAVMRDACCSP
jgi:hypothetical protein